MEKIYDEHELLSLFGRKYPIVIHEAKENYSYPFQDNLLKFARLNRTTVPPFEMDKLQKHYFKMMGPTIKRPDLIGFETDVISLTEDNKVEGFTANVCQYKHNVVTSHILDYELYLNLKKTKSNLLEKNREELLKFLPYRKKIHRGKTQTEVITTGCNRHSLLSVQMLVAFYDKDIQDYRVLMFKRSKDVAIKPNYWQIIPAGGFEIFETDQTVNAYLIKQHFDVELALFRELIEEAFDGQDFQENQHGDGKKIINTHDDVVKLRQWLKDGDASLEFIGNVVDLVSLRPELSFLLVIDNQEFARRKFKNNHEGKEIQSVPINDLPKMLDGELLYPSSAGLLKLAIKSKTFRDKGLLQEMGLELTVQ